MAEKILFFANTDWYLYNFRRSLMVAAQEAGFEVLLASPPGPYGERLRQLGFDWRALPMERRSLNPLREAWLLWQLRRLIRRERVALVHGFTIKCAIYGALAGRAAGLRRRVTAVTGLGYVFISQDLKARLLRPLVRALLRAALSGSGSRLILQNADDVVLFTGAGLVPVERVRLIAGSGVDCARFAPGPARGEGPLTVLLPARMLWDKGVAEFVEAARQLKAAGRDIECLLAGDPDPGNPAAVPEATLRGWEAEGLIRWLGHVEDMPALLRSVEVVALPSYREGLPKGLIEAGACGVALITTDVPGCRAVVTHEVDGLLVPVREAAPLAAAIARLQDDPALRQRLGAAARQRALQEFDERLVIERTLAVYRELIPPMILSP